MGRKPDARSQNSSETNSENENEESSEERSSSRSSSEQDSCPPGLEALQTMNQVFINQQVHLLEALTFWESSNQYSIYNSKGQECYTANEDSNCCCRQCCGNSRSFWIRIKDNTGREAIIVKRPFKCCYKGISWIACCRMCQDEISVTLGDGEVIGSIREACSLCVPHYKIYDANGDAKYEVWGQCCNCTCLCCKREVVFTVTNLENGEEIGQIKKVWSGIMKELFTDADNFGVTFPEDLDVKIKAVLVGLVFLIDFMHFETDEKKKTADAIDAAT